jgi:hypothetical protein
MSQFGKFVAPLAVAVVVLTTLVLTLASSDAAQIGIQPASASHLTVPPAFDKTKNLAPNLAAQRNIGIVNSLNKNRNISKGVSPDG